VGGPDAEADAGHLDAVTAPISEHVIRRRVQFYEVDAAGIVHFSWYFRYMEEAEHGLWRSAGLPIDLKRGVGFPRVAANFDFRRPLRFSDEFDVSIQVAAIGGKSIKYACTMTREGDVLAVGTMTVACVDPGPPMKAIPVPSWIRERLAISTERLT
jgi:YbgC/YbaW family acyl-CoA thioester hydrolase